MESSNEYQKVNYYNSLFIIKSKVCMFFGGLYKSLQEKNAFFKSGRYIAYINTKLLRERGSKNPPKEQQARKLSGKRTVIIKNLESSLRFISMENKNL